MKAPSDPGAAAPNAAATATAIRLHARNPKIRTKRLIA
jgi:hypothetical protein